jgi:hypothetical protein
MLEDLQEQHSFSAQMVLHLANHFHRRMLQKELAAQLPPQKVYSS